MKLFLVILAASYIAAIYPAIKILLVQRYVLHWNEDKSILFHFLSIWILVPWFYLKMISIKLNPMWLHFNKHDEFTGYSFPGWILTPFLVIMLVLAILLWPITATGWALYCFDKGKRVLGWYFIITIPIWFLKLFGVI